MGKNVMLRGVRNKFRLPCLVLLCILSLSGNHAEKPTETGERDAESVESLLEELGDEEGILPEGLELDLEEDTDGGQDEEMNLLEFLEEEREFFRAKDEDGSGGLSLDEFKVHFFDSVNDAADLMPDPDTGEVPEVQKEGLGPEDEEHAEWAFREFDANGDGSVTWEEWQSMMFHEAPQEPEYVDGSPSKDHEEAHLKRLFREWDKDQDGFLDRNEIVALFRSHRREMSGGGETDGEEDAEPITDDEIEMVTWQVFDDKDADGDRRLNLEEWIEGGAYF